MKKIFVITILAFMVNACAAKIPSEALQLSNTSLEYRQMQTRAFDTDEKDMLSASAQVLQDLEFQIDESETDLGVVVASKERDATEAGQVAGAVIVALLGGGSMPIDKNQKIRASVVTTPISAKQTKVRVTFQRLVWNTHNQLSKIEKLDDPEFYQGFFEKLSKSVFLEAHKI